MDAICPSRRDFLRSVLAATTLAGCRSGAAPTPLRATATAPALVGAGRDLAAAIAAARGAVDFVRAGDRVFVKVNLNSGQPFPYTTSAETAVALIELLRTHGAADILVGDRSFFGADTARNAATTGLAAAVRAAGAKWIVLDEHEPAFAWRHVRADDWDGGLRVPALYDDVDHVIHLATAKTHFITHYTMTLKLAFGSVHADDRRRNLSPHDTTDGRLWRQIAQAAAAYRPALHVLDARRPVITGGPDSGRTASHGALYASADPIALDVTGLAVLRTCRSPEPAVAGDPWAQPQLRAGIAAGLGITSATDYSLAV